MLSHKQPTNQPPTPAYIFRAHQHAIHALHFFQSNEFLASGDSSGLVIVWRLTTRRPARSWQAHDGGIMGIQTWGKGERRLITHGRDHKLRVWDLRAGDFDDAKILGRWNAEDGESDERDEETKPWLLHALDVNALNFCAFTICDEADGSAEGGEDMSSSSVRPILLAAPNGLDSGGVDVFHLPSERRVSKLQSDKDVNMGMVMCLRLFQSATNGQLMLIAGFEDGRVTLHSRRDVVSAPVWLWDRIMISRPHTQPILSLDVMPDQSGFVTSSADATIAKFSMPQSAVLEPKPDKVNETKHAGQQDLKIRSDGRLFATAGWDKRVRVYSAKTLKELAVLKWHQEGCYAVAFAQVDPLIPTSEQDSADSLPKLDAVARLKMERDEKVKQIHWLAAGSKDGKISLWDVY